MTNEQHSTARACVEGAEAGTLTFPEIVAALDRAGFDGYAVDFRRATMSYYLRNGEALVLDGAKPGVPVADHFAAATVREAIRQAQINAPGYTYRGFCDRVAGAGCAGYVVSFLGRRVLYYGRTAETHTEHFPPGLIS